MKKLNLLIVILILLIDIGLNGQDIPNPSPQNNSLSVLTHEDYLTNPIQYLSKINTENITTGALIDRVFFKKTIWGDYLGTIIS